MKTNAVLPVHEIITQLEAGLEKPYATCGKLAENLAALMESNSKEAATCLNRIAAAYESAGNETLRMALENGFLFELGNRIFQHPTGSACSTCCLACCMICSCVRCWLLGLNVRLT